PKVLHKERGKAAQSTPRPSFNIKFTDSGVIFSAAMTKSPSFSRSSSSTTIKNLPALKSSIASSIVFSNFCPFQEVFDIFSNHVHFYIDQSPDIPQRQVCFGESLWNNSNHYNRIYDFCYRKTNSI